MGACASKEKSGVAFVPEASVESANACMSRTTVEERIECSRSHWSESTQRTELLSVEEVAAIKLDNEIVFKAWQSHPKWGFFFWALDEFQEFKLGEKFAEGGQAELFDVYVRWGDSKFDKEIEESGRKCVVKVFKEGTSLRDLQRQWPEGIFQFRAAINQRFKFGKDLGKLTRSDVLYATLLEDGRFAFLMGKEDEDLRSVIDRKMFRSSRSGGGPFTRVDAEEHMFGVALGVDELHRYNVVHRDLKASNVLVYSNSGGTHCLVSDYECSIGVVGTGWWRAPEILQACKEGNVMEKPKLFSKAADIYSLGMTFYEILTGKHPFQDEEVTRDLIIEGRRPLVPRFIDEWAQQLLHWCWHPNCGARPSIEDILGILDASSSSKYIKHRILERLEWLREDETLATIEGGPIGYTRNQRMAFEGWQALQATI